MTRLPIRNFLTALVFAEGALLISGAAHADSPSCVSDVTTKDGVRNKTYVYGPSTRGDRGECRTTETGGRLISFTSLPGVRSVLLQGAGPTDSVYSYFSYDDADYGANDGGVPLPTWLFELMKSHRDEFREYAPKKLGLLEKTYAESRPADAPPARGSAASAIASNTSTATNSTKTPTTDPLKSQSQQGVDLARDTQTRADVKPPNNSRYGYLDLVQSCIELKETRRESNIQWYSVTNTCSMKVKFFSAPDSPRYGSLQELRPGQTDTSWWNYVKKPKLPWVACPADAPNGKTVTVQGDTNGLVSCRYVL